MTLADVTRLVQALIDAEDEAEKIGLMLKEANKKAQALREESLPSALQEFGVNQLRLETGQVITIKQDVYASIPKDGQQEAYAWLTDNGHGGLIKSEVQVSFDRGELDKASTLVGRLEEEGFHPEFQEKVHPQTLKAFLREQIAAGVKIPMDLFGARAVFVANIK